MTTKKLVNDPLRAVDDMLAGAVLMNPGLVKMDNHRVLLRSDLEDVLPGKVAVVCGGGSGHEPAFGGYVGDGMLHACIAGSVFASPPSSDILSSILGLAEHNPSGILVVVFNYTGDRVNFAVAVERAKALTPVPCEVVTVGDDTALESIDRTAGRRGLCGGILFLKMVGGMAKLGLSLSEIVSIAENEILPNLGTIGVCLRPCIVPGNDAPSFDLSDKEMEIGLGVHGEAGVLRTGLKSSKETIEMMLARMTNPTSATRLNLTRGDKVVLLLNNLGAISELEMGVIAKDAVELLREVYEVCPVRIFSGRYMTSLEMAGVQITILRVKSESILEYVDVQAQVVGWSLNAFPRKIKDPVVVPDVLQLEKYKTLKTNGPEASHDVQNILFACVKHVCDALVSNEASLNLMDTGSGDADCGSTLARGARKVKEILEDNRDHLVAFPSCLFREIAKASESEMGGSSGGMFSIFFNAATARLESSPAISLATVADALWTGLESVKKYGRARVGDRTLIDALEPGLESLKNGSLLGDVGLEKFLNLAAEAAENGAKRTLEMKANAGRASYVPSSELQHPDPGAFAMGIIFRGCVNGFQEHFGGNNA